MTVTYTPLPPAPVPGASDFEVQAGVFLDAMPQFGAEMKAIADDVAENATLVDVEGNATIAATAASQASISAVQAGKSATASGASASSALVSATAARRDAEAAALSAFQAGTNAVAAAESATAAAASAALADSEGNATSALESKVAAQAARDVAIAQAGIATTKAAESYASADAAAGSAASALAIYGNTAAQQAAVTAAQNAASVAAGHAASASSVVQQDLSGVNAAALHRSPNAVTAMFVYDTSKDSDGGAWTERCQHTSWYNEPLNGKWLGAQASEAAARAVAGATTGDYFQLTTDGKFYKLNAASGTTETFRGNKADFPRLSAIVAEAGNVTIYDLTEPGRPMWMRFLSTGANSLTARALLGNNNVAAITASSGVLIVGNSTNSGYQGSVISFPLDSAKYIVSGGAGTFKGTLANRNTAAASIAGGGYTINSTSINAVAMTVLPDAPVDPVTGLQVPTIAVATNSGVSVIKHDGVVVSQLQGTAHVAFSKDAKLWAAGSDGGSFAVRLINKAFTGVEASFTNIQYQIGAPYISGRGVQRIPQLRAVSGSSVYAVDPDTYTSVNVLRSNNSKRGATLAAYVSNTYNTGHMTGDIRRTYLAITGSGSVSDSELITNGTDFIDSDANGIPDGWTLNIPASVVNGDLVLSPVNYFHGGIQSAAFPTIPGMKYVLEFQVTQNTAGTIYYNLWPADSAWTSTDSRDHQAGVGVTTKVFTATSTSSKFVLNDYANTGTATIAYVSVKALEPDCSYKGKTANITGTLTRTPVATGSQLVAYSGFSA